MVAPYALPRNFTIPEDCPYAISQLYERDDSQPSLWLIREHDAYGEFPHIYAKVCRQADGSGVIVLSDTGCATETATRTNQVAAQYSSARPSEWNLRTFLEYTINPEGRLPYLVITTHCHYDHILGLKKLLPRSTRRPLDSPTGASPATTDASVQVLASAAAKSFIEPCSNLQRHSLCNDKNLTAPHYTVSIWASDHELITYHSPVHDAHISTNITILHTPGHSPDSLSWYDHDARLLCVGDSFYRKESDVSRSAPWGAEKPAPTLFSRYGDLVAWWGMMRRLLEFVRERNRDLEDRNPSWWDTQEQQQQQQQSQQGQRTARSTWVEADKSGTGGVHVNDEVEAIEGARAKLKPSRVRLAAGHVDYNDDAERAILAMMAFMSAILRDVVPSVQMDEDKWLWDYALGDGQAAGEYSLVAPLRLVEQARKEIHRYDEYA